VVIEDRGLGYARYSQFLVELRPAGQETSAVRSLRGCMEKIDLVGTMGGLFGLGAFGFVLKCLT